MLRNQKLSRAKTPSRKENQGPLVNALSRETDFVFALSAKLTTFGFDLLGAFASLRENIVLEASGFF